MKTTNETTLKNFNAWSGAVDTKEKIIEEGKTEQFDQLIEELYPLGIDEYQLNDLLRFETEWIFETLNIDTDE